MRIIIATTTTLIGALAITPQLAHADDKMELGAFLGLHLYSDDNELGAPGDAGGIDPIDDGLLFGVRVARRLHRLFSLEGELALSPATTRDTATDVVALGYRLHALVHPARFVDDRLEPFALIGLGGMTSASSDEDVLTNDSDFIVHAGIGAKYRIGDDWGVRFDARLLLPPATGDDLITVDGELLLGIYKTFGKKAAPTPAPAPAPVTAPVVPTPTDQDGDGIADAVDRCPGESEDRDGMNDEDGCPDLDDDGDGVADPSDRCPAQPETANGYQDHDGCPDEAPAKPFTGAISGVDFAVGSDRLTPGSSRALDRAVASLNEYPTLRLEISGHTDATGNPDANRDLSKRRAEAVKAYLVGKGIAADRLETLGHGPDQPIGDNTTAAGRARNRRVEFRTR